MPSALNSLAATTRALVDRARSRWVSASYEVMIGPGLLAEAGRLIATRLGKAKCAVVTDENVARYHLAALEASLQGRRPVARLDRSEAG